MEWVNRVSCTAMGRLTVAAGRRFVCTGRLFASGSTGPLKFGGPIERHARIDALDGFESAALGVLAFAGALVRSV